MKKTQAQKQMELLAALEKSSEQTVKERGDAGDNEKIDLFSEKIQEVPNKRNNYESYGAEDTGAQKNENPPPAKKNFQSTKKTNAKKKGDEDFQFFDIMGGKVEDQGETHIEVTLVKEGQLFQQASNPFQQQANNRVHDPLRDDIDDQIEHDPFSTKSSDQINSVLKVKEPQQEEKKLDSMANYQAGLSQKAAMRKKQIQKEEKEKEKEKESSTSHIDNLLAKVGNKGGAHKAIHNQIFDDEVGEVGEWVGKSAAANRQDSDEDDDDEKKDDDFDAVFEEPTEQQKETSAKAKLGQAQEQKNAVTKDSKEGSSNPSEIIQEKVNLNANFRVVKKKGQFANSLAEKAKAIAEVKEIQQMKERSEQERAMEEKKQEDPQNNEQSPSTQEEKEQSTQQEKQTLNNQVQKQSGSEDKKAQSKSQANQISKGNLVEKNKEKIEEEENAEDEEARENFVSVDLGEGGNIDLKIQPAEDEEEKKVTTLAAEADKKNPRQPTNQVPKKQIKSLGKKNISNTEKAAEQQKSQPLAQNDHLIVQKQQQQEAPQQKGTQQKATQKKDSKKEKAATKVDEQDLEAKELEAMNDEDWEEISKKNLEKMKQKKSVENKKPLVNFNTAWGTVKSLNLSSQKRQVAAQTEKSGGIFAKLFAGCSSNKLPGVLASERDQILAFAKVPFEDENEFHYEMLRSIFIKLTDNYNCPRYGPHWDIIGFQGRDPATDIRGAGMLGVLQILAYVSQHYEIMKDAYEFSIKDKMNPPLCSSMLSVTLIVMDLVREGKLNGQINSQRSAINAINNLYFAIYYKLYTTYKNQNLDILKYPILLKEVTEAAKRNPTKILNEFLQGLEGVRMFGK